MHPAIEAIRTAIQGTPFQGNVYLVGGAVRDALLGIPVKNDLDLVTRGSAPALAQLLWDKGIAEIAPVTYPRFGTAMIQIRGANIELVTARKESYAETSRKPDVEPATYEEDAQRRDFTVNALFRNIESEEVWDPLGSGLSDLNSRILRTPLDPESTFYDDPLRMLRAIRFRWQLDFELAPGLREAIQGSRERLRIVSFERIRDELVKMLARPTGPNALQDLMDTGLLEIFAPELVAMKGVDQGSYHHLDVWEHTLLAMRNLWEGVEQPGLSLVLGVLFHDIGKPPTRTIDPEGKIRFFAHEAIGAEMTRQVLRRLKFAERDIEPVARLVKNHMRLGSSPTFTPSAARRLLRDLGDQVDELLELVSADASALKPGIRKLDLAPIRSQLAQVQLETPRSALESPLSGEEIMEIKQIAPGLEVGKWKRFLTEKVLDGELAPGDKEAARQLLETSKF